MQAILKYILLTAVRDKLYLGLFIILLSAFGISCILGDASLIEKVQATNSYIGGSSRIIFAVGIILFVCFYVHRAFENREVEFILSKSIARHDFIFAYLLGFALVSAFILIPLSLIMLLMKANPLGLLYWSITLFLEALIIIAFSLLSSLILKSAVSAVLASLGFYILSRMMGFFVLTIKIPESISDVSSKNGSLHAVLKLLSIVFPRLDLFAKSEWLVYGVTNSSDFYIILGQCIIYIPLMIFMSFFDFNRKQF